LAITRSSGASRSTLPIQAAIAARSVTSTDPSATGAPAFRRNRGEAARIAPCQRQMGAWPGVAPRQCSADPLLAPVIRIDRGLGGEDEPLLGN
jgi:hypothetical protein